MKLHHQYHLYADGQWQIPVEDHVAALDESGLLSSLDFIGVGVVGSKQHRDEAISTIITTLKALKPTVNVQIVAEEDEGWEQCSLRAMDLSEPAKILYAHTKGAANPSALQARWRNSMTNAVIFGWQRCVEGLDEMDTVGCFFQGSPWRHYAGTYWWARSDYLTTLPPFDYSSRWEAEAWIGKGVGVFGDIASGHPATDCIGRGGIYRKGTVKANSKMFGFRPGKTYYDIEITDLMQAVSDQGRHLTVIESHPTIRPITVHTKR